MKSIALLLPLGLLPLGHVLAAAPVTARDDAPTAPSPDQAVLLRCSAAFALVAGDQARGAPVAAAYPPLATRGREFFVRASAQLMDELHLNREQVQAMLQEQVAELQQGSAATKDRAGYLDEVMQPCLETLEASGL